MKTTIHPACALCKGACCEFISLPPEALSSWLVLHGNAQKTRPGINLNVKCKALKGGLCSIYNRRPEQCIHFEVGGPGCLEAIAYRRHYKRKEILALLGQT